MGCICSRPEAVEFAGAQADVRARYSTDSLRHNADFAGDVLLGIHVHERHPHASTRSGGRSRHGGRSSSNLTRSQWKQMRALARSNTNPHFHQLQQLQVLPSHALSSRYQQQQPQQQPAAATATLAVLQHQQHHRHRHQPPMVHAVFSPDQAFQASQRQGAGFTSSALPSQSHHPLTSSKDRDRTHAARPKVIVLSPEQILALCGAVVEEQGPAVADAGIHPLLLASLCLMESGGCPRARQYRDHVGDVALGLCQVLLSTAQWLASSQGFDVYGSSPTASDLEDPKCCVYYCAAYLAVLSRHGGCQRSEAFIVKAYHAGPKGIDSDAAGLYWQKYLKAKYCLKEVARAMAVSVATAAATAGLSLQPLAALPAAVIEDSLLIEGAASTTAAADSSSRCSSASINDRSCSMDNKDAGCNSSEGVLVWAAAAKLITDLASSWDAAASAQPAATVADTAVSSSSGSFIAHILPSFWPSAGGSRTQLQQQQISSFSNAGAGRSNRHRHADITVAGAGASSSDGSIKGCRHMVPVTRAAVDAAVLRLCCIDHSSTCIALSNAAAAAALYGSHVRTALTESVQPPAAASRGGGPWYQRRRSNAACTASSNGVSSAGDDDAPSQSLPPCVMHVVGQGETLNSIASICGIAVPDILAANPDIGDAGAIQPHDCIALPLPVVSPRLYVIQQGDSLHSIAKALRTSLGRIVAKNPELTDSSRVQPGWVILLPGLKGDSLSGAALRWLAEAAAVEAATADDLSGRDTVSVMNSGISSLGSGDEGSSVLADTADPGFHETSAGFRIRRSGTRQQGSFGGAAVDHGHTAPVHKDVHDEGCEDIDSVQQDQRSSLSRDVRDCSTAVAVEVSRSSKDWSYASHGTACTVVEDGRLSTAVQSAGETEIRPSLPAATVGSGLYMFSVGQSVAV